MYEYIALMDKKTPCFKQFLLKSHSRDLVLYQISNVNPTGLFPLKQSATFMCHEVTNIGQDTITEEEEDNFFLDMKNFNEPAAIKRVWY